MKLIWLSVFYFAIFALNAQNKTGQDFFSGLNEVKEGEGVLEITQAAEIKDLVGIHIDSNKRAGGIDGFRIQLFLGSSNTAKKDASQVKARLLELFPQEHIYVMYEAPFWRVQVGDFRSKNESLYLYRKLKKEFPGCYPVPVNNIKMSDLE